MKQSILDNKLVIDLNLSNKKHAQQIAIKKLIAENNFDSLMRYLNSFDGKYTRSVYIDRLASQKHDLLSRKDKNTILKKFQSLIDPNINHTPNSSSNTFFGVEIECFIPKNQFDCCEELCPYCEGSGECLDDEDCLTCPECNGDGTIGEINYRDRLKSMFIENKIRCSSVKGDGSIVSPSDCFPVEITVLSKFDDTANLKKVCDLLNKLGAKVNKSCGLHVHLDARHLKSNDAIKIGTKFKKALPVMLAMVPKSRRGNQYCAARISSLKGTRYCAVNLTAFSKYNTIEVRLHSGTTDFNKIMNWANLVNAIKNSDIKKSCKSINELTDHVKINEELVEYMTQRTALFSPECYEDQLINPAMRDNDDESVQLDMAV